jgi:hypothetical protein
VDDFNRIEGNINYIENENRTPNQSETPVASGVLQKILDFLATQIKKITGKSNWYNAPATTLEATKEHIDSTNAHNATSAATANRIILRDTNGRAKVAAPSASDDIARKDTVDNHANEFIRHGNYAVATGSANTYAVTLSPAPSAYVEGMCVAVKINVNNTGASTLNVNSKGAKSIKKPNGNDVTAGNLKAGSVYTLRYNGTNFILQGSDSSGNATPGDVRAGKTFSNDFDTDLIGTAVIAPPEFIYIAGFKMLTPTYQKSGTYAFAREGNGFYELGWDRGSSATSQYAEITFATPIDVTNCSKLHAVGRVESSSHSHGHEARIELNSEYYSGSGAGDRAGGSISLEIPAGGVDNLKSLNLTGKTGLYYLRLICRVTSSTYVSDAYNYMYVHYIVLR